MRLSQDQRVWMSEQQWFHAIDFGDGAVSPGRFSEKVPPNYTLFGFFDLIRDLDLTGARCLDIGTMDGIAGFIMKQQGAQSVIATDLAERETFAFGRDALGLDIEYRTPVSMFDLAAALDGRKVDVAVMAGVLYHLFDPLSALSACREMMRRDGYLLLETTYLFDRRQPLMSFNPVDSSRRGIERANVFWRPSKAAVEGMLEVVGFEVVASVSVDARITFLARARRPSEIASRSQRVEKIHSHYMAYTNYRERVDYNDLEQDDSAPSRVRYTGAPGDRWLYRALYRPRAPFHPEWPTPRGAVLVRELARSFRIKLATDLARVR